MPRLGRPTWRATWSDLEGTLPGGGVDRLTGAVGRGFTWQLVVAPLSKDCWEFRHGAEVLDGFKQCVCKALAMGLLSAYSRGVPVFILFPSDDVNGPQ
jgi:hypothetical protein